MWLPMIDVVGGVLVESLKQVIETWVCWMRWKMDLQIRNRICNFAGESGWPLAIKREPGVNPGQSRCGKSL